MNSEIEEILRYLQNRDDYAIWAGMAQHIQLGLKHSADVDIYVKSSKVKQEISKDFIAKGWKLKLHKNMSYDWDKLEKNETTFDIIYTPESAGLILPNAEQGLSYGFKLKVISKEWLFLTKFGQMSWADRSEKKRKRDVDVINRLRKMLDMKNLQKIVSKLPDKYWKLGEI